MKHSIFQLYSTASRGFDRKISGMLELKNDSIEFLRPLNQLPELQNQVSVIFINESVYSDKRSYRIQ